MSLLGILGSAALTVLPQLFGGKQEAPQYDSSQINALIKAYRQFGMEGIQRLMESEQGATIGRMASQGYTMTPAMMQDAFTKIMETGSTARAGLERDMLGMQMGAAQRSADVQYQGDLQKYQSGQDFWSSLSDIGGMLLTNTLSPQGSLVGKNFNQWLLPEYSSGGPGYGLAG